MKLNYLFASKYKKIGWMIFFPTLILGLLMITSSILVAFSKEVDEDEFISKIRLESLVWATYMNYGILFLAFIFCL